MTSHSQPVVEIVARAIAEARRDSNTESALRFIDVAGYAIVPKAPTEAMVAATLPIDARQPTEQDKKIAARALLLLSGGRKIAGEEQGFQPALDLIADYRAMIAAYEKQDASVD